MTSAAQEDRESEAEHAGRTDRLRAAGEPTITVTAHGPYLVEGPVSVSQTDGTLLRTSGPCYLCRCGGSKSKPFCDATHGLKGFDGTETAGHDLTATRRTDHPRTDGAVVHDDRSRCAHFGQCTDRLPTVFDAHGEPFVHPDGAAEPEVADVVRSCPSGALTYTPAGAVGPEEHHERASVTPVVDGPYRVRGAVTVVGADGQRYESRERQTLCRCGQSGGKPFCDGSHWYAGFRDPLPPELEPVPPTLYAWAGGIDALQELTRRFYSDLLDEPDPVLEPVFRGMDPHHPLHVAAWLAETFGGPDTYTAEHGGYHHMVRRHQGLRLTEEQRLRWITRMAATADLVGLPDDPDFRSAFVGYLEWGTRIALFNSQPGVAVIEHAPVPRWSWGGAPPFIPFPWTTRERPLEAARFTPPAPIRHPVGPSRAPHHRTSTADPDAGATGRSPRSTTRTPQVGAGPPTTLVRLVPVAARISWVARRAGGGPQPGRRG